LTSAPRRSILMDYGTRQRKRKAMTDLTEDQMIQIIAAIVTRHGCRILKMDVQNQILDIDGPEEAKLACARELEMFLQ